MTPQETLDFAIATCHVAGERARAFFEEREKLKIDVKGVQDWVSNADREVELLIRARLAEARPEDGIIGEEHAPVAGSSGFDWVIDPIDGTANFVNGIPAWVVVLAGVSGGRTQIGVIHDPIHNETFAARRGGGAFLNGAPIRVSGGQSLLEGSIAIGYSNRLEAAPTLRLLHALLAKGGVFHRNASGALSLAYVASGRLLGYAEEHMNAWDCLAGQLLVAEAGGRIEDQDAQHMIASGGRVIASAPAVFDTLRDIASEAWDGEHGRQR